MICDFVRRGLLVALAAAGGWVTCALRASAAGPPVHDMVFTVVSNVAAGSALYLSGNRPELGGLTTTGAVRMYDSGGNTWIGRVSVRGSVTTSSLVGVKFFARTTTSGTHCTPGNGTIPSATTLSNTPPWIPGYTGKTVYYHSGLTNVSIIYSSGGGAFTAAAMSVDGPGRVAGEFRYKATGIGHAGESLEFVMQGYSGGNVVYDHAPYTGYGTPPDNNYYTFLDHFFLQDGNIFNYFPPATISAPQVVTVNNWPSSYTGNGIPSRGGRVYLPRGYTQNAAKRYPVLYMHDGQNVFDPGGPFGSWSADAAATREISQGRMRETIIVAVNNTSSRFSEYGTPMDGYTGDYYLKYLVNNVKPSIDSTYRTLTNFMNTGNMGSSLGGLISAYIGLSSNVFGLIGAMSPSYWYAGNFRNWINANNTKGNRIWQDCGTTEGSSMWDYFWPVYAYYMQDGYSEGNDIKISIGCGQGHNEAAWANRVGAAFQYLYNPLDETNGLLTNAAPPSGILQFASDTLSISETSAFVRLFVTREGGSNGAASVNFFTSNGTALAGAAYTAVTGTLSWAHHDAADKFFDVPILNDEQFNGNRDFSARLAAAIGASLGNPSIATVTILDDESPPPPPPEIAITNPPMDIVVGPEVEFFDLKGLANPGSWSGLAWSNSLTGAYGEQPLVHQWVISGIALGVGSNVITVTATNPAAAGMSASDSGTNTAYDSGWTNGANGGTGWNGGWLLFNTATAGHFMSESQFDANNDVGPRAWGLWSHVNHTSDARRLFSAPLEIGQVLSFRFDNNAVATNGRVGFSLQNAGQSNLFEFGYLGGVANYRINASTLNRNTGIPLSSNGWDVTFQLTTVSNYTFTLGTNVITGSLATNADPNIVRFRVYNRGAGGPAGGPAYNLYFNDVALNGGMQGAGPSTSDTVTIVREPPAVQDGIPVAWWQKYGLGPTNTAAGDNDADGATNWEEYIADTDPTNAFSYYANWIYNAAGHGEITLQVGPPTTNSRLYDVWYSPTLVNPLWSPFNVDRSGADGGGPIFITVTNEFDGGVYRTGVKLP